MINKIFSALFKCSTWIYFACVAYFYGRQNYELCGAEFTLKGPGGYHVIRLNVVSYFKTPEKQYYQSRMPGVPLKTAGHYPGRK